MNSSVFQENKIKRTQPPPVEGLTYVTYLLYCLELRPGRLFLSSNFLPQLLNETGDYTRPAFIYLISITKSQLHTLVLYSPGLSLIFPSAYFTDSSLKGTLQNILHLKIMTALD